MIPENQTLPYTSPLNKPPHPQENHCPAGTRTKLKQNKQSLKDADKDADASVRTASAQKQSKTKQKKKQYKRLSLLTPSACSTRL